MRVSGVRSCGRIQRCSVSEERSYLCVLRRLRINEESEVARLAFINRFDVGNGSQNGAEGPELSGCWRHMLCTVCRVCVGPSSTSC